MPMTLFTSASSAPSELLLLPNSFTANLTVAIATRNRPEALGNCLDALLMGAQLPAEIVVVDQSEGEATRQAVDARQSTEVTLRYVRHLGQGLGAAQNLAVAHAAGPIVAVTDDDCVPALDWVAGIAQLFSRPGGIDVVTGRVLPWGPDVPGQFAVALRTNTQPADFAHGALPWNIGSGNNFAARREWLLRIGGLDQRLGPGSPGQGGVDMDLFYRLLLAGARIRYEPDVVVYHRRTDRAGRLARRSAYGFGMGVCVSFWSRLGDAQAGRVLGAWLLMRLRRLASGAWRGSGLRVYEEALVLAGTCRGLAYGWRLTGMKS